MKGRRIRRAGRGILAIWIPTSMRDALRRTAAAEKRSQRQIVEDALRAYFARRLPAQAPSKSA